MIPRGAKVIEELPCLGSPKKLDNKKVDLRQILDCEGTMNRIFHIDKKVIHYNCQICNTNWDWDIQEEKWFQTFRKEYDNIDVKPYEMP